MKYGFLALIIAVALASCNLIDRVRVRGNGKLTAKDYHLKEFKSIEISGEKSLALKKDSVLKVRIETDENLIDLLDVRVNNGVLSVSARDGYWIDPTDKVRIYVSMPFLKNLRASGASEVQTDGRFAQDEKLGIELSGASEGMLNLRAPDIVAQASGASTLTISGEARNVKADINGASTFNAFDLKTETNTVDASGASTANVFASIQLKAGASGASKIRYKGNPNVSQDISGAGSVKKEENN